MRVLQILEEFPENNVLSEIIECAKKFEQLSLDNPLMKFTAALSRLLMQCDEWQKLADREHSILNQFLPLQKVLVDWHRLEVLCWTKLLDQVEQDTFQLAVLSSWPLIQVAIKGDEPDTKVLLMLIDWLNNSSFLDFGARLWTGRLLSRIIRSYLNKVDFARRVDCVVSHFEQFVEIRKLTQAKRETADKELSEFIKVVQYNDLNLYSIQQSAQRAHAQLFRILKNFRVSNI